jgi:hypothetical protein
VLPKWTIHLHVKYKQGSAGKALETCWSLRFLAQSQGGRLFHLLRPVLGNDKFHTPQSTRLASFLAPAYLHSMVPWNGHHGSAAAWIPQCLHSEGGRETPYAVPTPLGLHGA